MRLWLPVAVGIWVVGCGSSGGTSTPRLVTLDMKAKGIFGACQIAGLPPNEFAYSAYFAEKGDAGRVAYTTIASDGTQFSFDAGFDGVRASFGSLTTQGFSLMDGGNCDACEMKFWQGADLALVSPSQNTALGDMCPSDPLADGGVPYDPDAGIFASQRIDGGYDTVRACGVFNVNITGEGINCDPACYSCVLRYRLTGTRAN